MMKATSEYLVVRGEGYRALRLPYKLASVGMIMSVLRENISTTLSAPSTPPSSRGFAPNSSAPPPR